MYVRIHKPPEYGGNKGSCRDLVQYLDKENRDLEEFVQQGFFSHTENNVQPEEVERVIDGNKGRLGKNETKFYMISVNPSEKELAHIGSNEEKLKSYVRDLMQEYADRFNRTYENGQRLTANDLVYYAKIEHERTYKYEDRRYRSAMEHNREIKKEIIKNLGDKQKIEELKKQYIRDKNGVPILEGNVKEGNNTHVHIIVSRYDKNQKFKLSPLANQRKGKGVLNGKEHEKGFYREEFVRKAEQLFDKKFEYQRALNQSFDYYRSGKMALLALNNPKAVVKSLVKQAILKSIEDKTLQKALKLGVTNPKYIPKQALKEVEKQATKAVLTALNKTAYTNPVTASINIAKEAIVKVGEYISKSASI